MRLDQNWRTILRKAWSMRLMGVAIVLSIVEAVLPVFQSAIPAGIFAGLTAVVVGGAMIARVVWQQDL